MDNCTVCSDDFTDVGHFEITPYQRTGVKCGRGGHPLCNLCFARIWPRICPVCKDEMRGFDFPKELALHLKAAKKKEDELEDMRVAVRENQSEMAQMCQAQNAVLMMTQMFGPQSIVDRALEGMAQFSAPGVITVDLATEPLPHAGPRPHRRARSRHE